VLFRSCISYQPDTPLHGLEGLKHMQTAIVPGIYDAKLADEHLEVSTDAAHEMARRLAKTEGILVGVSSAASMVAVLQLAGRLEEGVIVTVFPDHGSRYLSERFWEE
jgi:cysteine synthase B